MKLSLMFVAVAGFLAMFTETKTQATTLKQDPLFFGRRGLNPNMNSLFFGKRGSPDSRVSLNDLKNACSMLMTYLDEVENLEEA